MRADWPMPADFPDFPSKDQMLAYLKSYAAHFGIDKKIQYNTRAVSVKPYVAGDGVPATLSCALP